MTEDNHGSGPSERNLVIMDALHSNNKKVGVFETILYIAGGCAAGILGMTNISGLLFFLFVSLIVTAALGVKIGFEIHEYLNTNIIGMWINAASSHALSFVLFWTLSYALVYIY